MSRLWKALTLALAVVALAILAISCGSAKTSYRVIDAIANYNYSGTGGFDITMNGSIEFSSVQFTNIDPAGKDAYEAVPSGSNNLEVFPHGDATTGGTPIINSSLSFNGRTQYTVLLMGNNLNNPYVSQPFTDNNAVPTTGDFEFRVIDAANNLGSQQLDIYVVGEVSLVTEGQATANATITYGQATPYISNPGNGSTPWFLVVTPHGVRTPIIQPTSYTPAALQIETIVLVDGPNGFGLGTPLIFGDLN